MVNSNFLKLIETLVDKYMEGLCVYSPAELEQKYDYKNLDADIIDASSDSKLPNEFIEFLKFLNTFDILAKNSFEFNRGSLVERVNLYAFYLACEQTILKPSPIDKESALTEIQDSVWSEYVRYGMPGPALVYFNFLNQLGSIDLDDKLSFCDRAITIMASESVLSGQLTDMTLSYGISLYSQLKKKVENASIKQIYDGRFKGLECLKPANEFNSDNIDQLFIALSKSRKPEGQKDLCQTPRGQTFKKSGDETPSGQTVSAGISALSSTQKTTESNGQGRVNDIYELTPLSLFSQGASDEEEAKNSRSIVGKKDPF